MSGDLALDLHHMCERSVPARLQFARNQPVGRIDGVILPESAIGSVARCFEIAVESLAYLIPPMACVLLRSRRGGDGAGADDDQQRVLDSVIDAQAAEGDAARLGIVHPAAAATVAWDLML